jgi:single-strand DNA-binding protein
MNDASVTLTGNVATAVRFARTDKGVALASFRMACTPRHFDRGTGQWIDERTTFVTVACFRALAENVVTSLTKGDPIVITGKLRVVPWERDDKSGISVEVEAAAVGHDLNRGQTRFARVRKELTNDPAEAADADSEPAADDGRDNEEAAPVGALVSDRSAA